ncbi:MAG TPA: hypothetical protein VND20_04180 [Candidatus Binataceae bacterium]|nr:hypothetical protein [Candidatus Binataceae bacterium]
MARAAAFAAIFGAGFFAAIGASLADALDFDALPVAIVLCFAGAAVPDALPLPCDPLLPRPAFAM